jgi:hypothetical protein
MEGKGRRLSDRIIDAFEMACENRDLEVAESLYRSLEIVLTRQGGKGNENKRHNVAFIHEAAQRLAALRGGEAA